MYGRLGFFGQQSALILMSAGDSRSPYDIYSMSHQQRKAACFVCMPAKGSTRVPGVQQHQQLSMPSSPSWPALLPTQLLQTYDDHHHLPVK